nr:MAG TPA: hypothetical protein [Caudoviricetes sp.]
MSCANIFNKKFMRISYNLVDNEIFLYYNMSKSCKRKSHKEELWNLNNC